MGAILAFAILGLFAGLLGRAVYPGRQRMGFFGTIGLGMAGSFVGGTLGTLIGGGGFGISRAGFLGSIVGVIVILFVLRRLGPGGI